MELIIDSSDAMRIVIRLSARNSGVQKVITGRRPSSRLLGTIESLTRSIKKTPSSISAIQLIPGVAWYTSQRVVAVVANTLAQTLRVPLIIDHKRLRAYFPHYT